jgi:type IV pilus assembly protein PilA
MRMSRMLRQKRSCALPGTLALTVFLSCAVTLPAQQPVKPTPPANPWQEDMDKFPGLPEELAKLASEIVRAVQLPGPRSQSALLPELPESTIAYGGLGNYGDAANTALMVLHRELKDSAVLRDWWAHGKIGAGGPQVEHFLEKYAQFCQYVGDEVVVTGALEGKNPKLLIVAQIAKPGLRQFLTEMIAEKSSTSVQGLRVLGPEELATAKDAPQMLTVLVRSDFLAAGSDLHTLRVFNSQVDKHGAAFAASAFGKRIMHEYDGGVSTLGAADLGQIIGLLPTEKPEEKELLERTGLSDVKYVVWDRKKVSGAALSQAELSFTGPRRGIAAWLARPQRLTNLDYLSPKSMLAVTFVFASLSQMLNDVRRFSANPKGPDSFAALDGFEHALKFSMKDDVLNRLTGEVSMEIDDFKKPGEPLWRLVLGVKDSEHLQQTLNMLLAAGNITPQRVNEDGVTYNVIHTPTADAKDMVYTFLDGHLIIAPSKEQVAAAVHLHTSGESLEKDKAFLAGLPPGRGLEASGVWYQDSSIFMQRMYQANANLAARLATPANSAPTATGIYADETTIRSVSKNVGMDAAAVMVVAAIAIPNLMRSKMAANEASAIGNIRTLGVAQITYDNMYPAKGYARDLAALGPDARGPQFYSAEHAGLVDGMLGNPSCKGNEWCIKSGYKFRSAAVCRPQKPCTDFVTVATPVSTSTGTRSFCSTSKLLIHLSSRPPLTDMISVAECEAWPLIK